MELLVLQGKKDQGQSFKFDRRIRMSAFRGILSLKIECTVEIPRRKFLF